MPVKMQPTSVIKARLGLEPNGRAQSFFTSECAKAMDKFIPKDEGNLRLIKDIQSDRIVYESPYARYQYYGKKMVMSNGKSAFYSKDYGFWSKKGEKKTLTNEDLIYHTPGTGPYWDKRMWSAKGQDIVKRVQEKFGGK